MSELPDFAKVAERYKRFSPGQKAELRRVKSPEEVNGIPAFYRLFPGTEIRPWMHRLAYLLPWAPHKSEARSLGRQLPVSNLKEMEKSGSAKRLYQIVRAAEPNDLIQLRRLLQHVQPTLDWRDFGRTVYFWGPEAKRGLLEQFFVHQSSESSE